MYNKITWPRRLYRFAGLGTHRLDCWNRLVYFDQYELWSQSSRESRTILIIIQPMHKLVWKGQSFKGEFRVGADFIK